MAVVRGDRIGESVKLNSCSVEAQTFYAAFIAAVPDDFGRFRLSPVRIWVRMFPRREPTAANLRKTGRLVAELRSAKLFEVWTVDGVEFAEMTGWKPTGNLYHRTPEPIGSVHVHSKRCGTTAMARAREWGDAIALASLSILLSKVAVAEPEQKANRGGTEGGAEVEHPSRPSRPSPSSHNEQQTTSVARPPADAETVVVKVTWLTPYYDAWKERWGQESEPPAGEMAKYLHGPNGKLGPDELVARWKRFLAAADTSQWARPSRFVQGLGEWADRPLFPKRGRETDADLRGAAAAFRRHDAGSGLDQRDVPTLRRIPGQVDHRKPGGSS
jgi:hypothetical protein